MPRYFANLCSSTGRAGRHNSASDVTLLSRTRALQDGDCKYSYVTFTPCMYVRFTGRFEMLFLCDEAPQFFRRCPLPPWLSGRQRSMTWIYGLVMFRSIKTREFICMDRRGRVVTKVRMLRML